MPASDRGSSLVETAIILFFCVTLFAGGLRPVAAAFTRLWLEHTLYRFTLCELQNNRSCRPQFLRRTRLLTWGHLLELNSHTTHSVRMYKTAQSQLRWCLENGGSTCREKNIFQFKIEVREKDLADIR